MGTALDGKADRHAAENVIFGDQSLALAEDRVDKTRNKFALVSAGIRRVHQLRLRRWIPRRVQRCGTEVVHERSPGAIDRKIVKMRENAPEIDTDFADHAARE